MNDPGYQAIPSASAEASREVGREAARLGEVLFEQLNYLLDHAGNCSPGCPDCARLVAARAWLLLPFRSASFPATRAER